MNHSERPLKIASYILSGLLVASALLYFVFGQDAPVVAEAVMEYSAPEGFDPSELSATLEALRTDEAFLKEVAFRSGLSNESEPEFDGTVTRLARGLTFETNFRESSVAVRFVHRKSATAMEVATTAATVAKEKLEQQREELAREILRQEDLVNDMRKLLEHIRRIEALNAVEARTESGWGLGGTFIDPKHDNETALNRLADLKARRVVSIAAIRATTLTGD